jgi:hypothetical protein
MPVHAPNSPEFTVLTTDECWSVLEQNHVGRIAFLNQGVVDIEPVHYVASDLWVFARSAEGTKLDAFSHDPYVAFEVDEIAATFDWCSVVVHGTVYLMSEQGSRVDRLTFERALESLRSFIPGTFSEDDPTPLRRTIYGIHVDRVSGRRAVPRATDGGKSRVAQPRALRQPRTPDGF